MEVLIKLNPAEAISAIDTGAFKFILEAAHAAQDQAENAIKTAKAELKEEVKQQVQNNQQPMQPNCAPGTQQPANQQQGYAQQSQVQQPAVPIAQPSQAPMQTGAPIEMPIQASAGTVPTTAQTYTMDQLAVAATQLVDAGRRQELVSLLAAFGVQALTALPKEQYGAFATQLRAMGAKI